MSETIEQKKDKDDGRVVIMTMALWLASFALLFGLFISFIGVLLPLTSV